MHASAAGHAASAAGLTYPPHWPSSPVHISDKSEHGAYAKHSFPYPLKKTPQHKLRLFISKLINCALSSRIGGLEPTPYWLSLALRAAARIYPLSRTGRGPSVTRLSVRRWLCGSCGPPGGGLGAPGDHLAASLGEDLGASRGYLETTWGHVEAPRGYLGSTWGWPGGTWRPLGGTDGPPWGEEPPRNQKDSVTTPQIGCPKGGRGFKYGYRLSLFT